MGGTPAGRDKGGMPGTPDDCNVIGDGSVRGLMVELVCNNCAGLGNAGMLASNGGALPGNRAALVAAGMDTNGLTCA